MRIIFIMLLIASSTFAFANQGKMYKVPYIVEQNDTLAKMFSRFVYPDSVITKNTPMTQKTFSENPSVKNWNAPVPGSRVDLYIAHEYMDMAKYEEYLRLLKDALAKLKRANETENGLDEHIPEGLKASIFYMASYGRFTQTYPEAAEIEFYQNSPVTFGSSFSFYPKGTNWSFAGSAYFAHLLASSNNLNNNNVKVPLEVGGNFYNEYRFSKRNFTGFFGLDYEKFSTFNIGGIQEQEILLDQNSVLYLTVGASKLIHIFGSPFFTKVSFSQSISTSIEPHPDGIPSKGGYDGYKVLFYLNKKFNNRIFLHSLLKYHSMEGPSELSTIRLGVGFGYILL